MKILYYQRKGETFSINLLFDIIRGSLPDSIETGVVRFTHDGASFLKRFYDIILVAFNLQKAQIHHVVGDFNYATFLMRKSITILTIHDLYRLYVNKRSPLKRFLLNLIWLRLPIAKSVVVTTVSKNTRQEILRYANCSPDKIRVIYNCISPYFVPVKKAFNKEKPVLLQMGTRHNKNLHRIIEAIAGISCKLDIVGVVDQKTIQLLNHHNIEFSCKSGLTNEEVMQRYVNADMLVFVSLFEGFGMPIVEANAVGRAVVTGNCSAMPEIAGNAACLVNPLDVNSIRSGILKVINDDQYRQQLIDNGLINKERFDAKKIADEYFHLYQEVFAKSSKPLPTK